MSLPFAAVWPVPGSTRGTLDCQYCNTRVARHGRHATTPCRNLPPVVRLPSSSRAAFWVLRLQVRVATLFANALLCVNNAHSDLQREFLGKVRRHCDLRHQLLALALALEARAFPRGVSLAIVEFLEDGAILCRKGCPVSEPFGGEDIVRSWIWVGCRRTDMTHWANNAR